MSASAIENEILTIQKKHAAFKKEMEKLNEVLNENAKLYEKYRSKLEISLKEKNSSKENLSYYLAVYEEKEYNIMKNLVDRLKLSARFVNNSQF